MGRNESYGTCKWCGFTTYFAKGEKSKECPYCKLNGVRSRITPGGA